MFRGCPSLRVGKIRVPHRGDNGPVLAYRAPLNPRPTEPDRLQRCPGYPDRREEVALSAPNNDIAAHFVAETASDQGSNRESRNDEDDPSLALEPHASIMARDLS